MTEQDKREKVINGLGSCVEYFASKVKGVMFDEWLEESRKAIALLKEDERAIKFQSDRLDALLKEQAPIKPFVDIDTLRCGYCGHTLEHQQLLGDNVLYHEQYDYCPQCGKAVAWK